MKPTPTLRFSIQRFFILTLVSFVAASAILAIVASANKSNRTAKARAAQAANSKSAIIKNSLSPQPLAPLAPAITATLTDNIPAATKVAPGGTINYTATITNTGVSPTDDATNLNFSDTLDSNTTLTAGSIHASPLAFNDTYNWVGNTFLDTAARALPAVTANDVAVNAPGGTDTFTLTTIAGGGTTLGGTVSLAANGSFTYTPPLGRPNIADGTSATDTFTYTIANSADGTLTGTGTVNIVLTGRVWYLQAGAAGDGRSGTPSGSPSAMSTAADKTTDIFYIFSGGAGNLNGLFTLDNSQQLLGQGVNLVVNAITLFTATSNPTTTNTTGNGVTLANGNTLRGFNIGNCSGTAISGAASVGTLTVNTLSINTTGAGLDLTGTGNPAVSVVLGGLTSTGGTKNVNLVNLGGTITLASGALSGASGNAFDVNGGVATITYSGTISNSGAKQVNIANMTGGSVALSGAVGGTGTGINLATNTGATISFTGGIALSTGANNAFSATGGGTVTATQNNTTIVNTLTTTSGTALAVTNTTIGVSGLTFRSVSSNGAANGINLNTTGASGGFTVTGNSSGFCGGQTSGTPPTITQAPAAADCTGGTIQSSTGAGILLNSTSNVSLTRMRVINGGDDGVGGTTVTGFTLSDSLFDNNGNAVGEEGLDFDNLLGTSSITNSTISLSHENNVEVRNTTNNGSQATLTVTGCQISNASAKTQSDDGVLYQMITTANGSINVSNSVLTANRGDHLQGNSANSAILNVVFTNNNLIGGHSTALGQDIVVNSAILTGSAAVTYDINGNKINGAILSAITVNLGVPSAATTTMTGKVRNNVIGTTGVIRSCSTQAHGIAVDSHGKGTHTVSVTGNTMRQCKDRGINVTANDSPSISNGEANPGGNLFLTVQSNTVLEGGPINPPGFPADGTGSREAFNLIAGSTATDTIAICAQVGGAGALANNFNRGTEAIVSGLSDIRIKKQTTAVISIQLPGYVGSATDASAFVAGNNTSSEDGSSTATASATSSGGGGGGFVGGAACAQPSAPNPADDTVRSPGSVDTSADVVTRVASPITTTIAKASAVAPAKKQADSPVNKPSAMANAVPSNKSRRDARLSHHVVRSYGNVSSDEPNAPLSGETVSLNTIATFPAGKSITIKYAATVNTPPLARQVSTQGTVSGSNFASVMTDDPSVGGASDPTVTLVDTLVTWNGSTNTDWNTATNWTPPAGGTQYAPGVTNPAVNDVIIPAVATQPTIGTSDIGIYSLSLASGMTLTITSPLILTIGGSPGGDLTLDGIISSGFLNFGTGTHVITNAGGTGSLSSTNVATVLNGSTVTLNNNLQAGALAVNTGGSMNITNRTLSLNGSGAALAIQGGGTFTTTGSTVIFNGTAAQTAAGVAYNNLTINNTAAGAPNALGATLAGNATVNGVLALTSNDLNTGAFTLTQPNTTASTGAGDVVGTVIRSGGPFGLISLTFGNPNNIITFTEAGTRPTTLTVVMAKAAPATYAAAVQRNYTLSQTGGSGFTATVRLHYLDSELNGNTPESSLGLRRFRTSDSHWVAAPPPPGVPTVDTSANWVEAIGVLAADLTTQWTFSTLAPTATGGTVTGRITDDQGRGVEGAVVRLDGTQNRKFITDANGFYRFDNVETNGFYTVTPSRSNYTFNPSVRSFSQIGETTEAAFGATLTSGGFVNPLDTPEYFVRQHYVDFLGREPDESGFNFWSDQILGCGADANCVERRRENVSAAYFLSIEFQETGGLVDGLYRVAYGARPNFAQFMPDTRTVAQGVVVGQDGWQQQLAANKEAFVAAFVNRPTFAGVYGNMSNDVFVDTLISHTAVSFTSGERDALVSGLANGTLTRSAVLRSIAENRAFVSAKFNDAFVMMEYFGYLRRNPQDPPDNNLSGFNFWLNKLNEFGGNFEQAEMVKAFIVSGEYRDRFPR